jgi:hypothetical protein
LALPVHAQDNRVIGRIQIQPHDASHLFYELRVFGKLEILHSMRLQPKSTPDPHLAKHQIRGAEIVVVATCATP